MALYFQALDENGMMVQNMRSATYIHPGETLSCIGCLETKQSTPKNCNEHQSYTIICIYTFGCGSAALGYHELQPGKISCFVLKNELFV